jgi:hypothetical protein
MPIILTLIVSLAFLFSHPCYVIDNLNTTVKSAKNGTHVGVYATVNNCYMSSKRLYVIAQATSACGETSNIFVSSAKTYNPNENKYFYADWRVPNRYSAFPFSSPTMCKGTVTITMTVYEKNFWGISKYVSSAKTYITIK